MTEELHRDHAKTRSYEAARLRNSYLKRWLRLSAVVLGILVGEFFPFVREIVESEDGGNRANRYARAAVNAFNRINIKHVRAFKLRLILLGMYAVNRAGVHAGGIFGSNAGLCNYICHKGLNLRVNGLKLNIRF
jgi:hypothetical protein